MKINYCVVTQSGNNRRTRQYAPEKLVGRHLDFLQKHQSPIDKVTVIINTDFDEHFLIIKRALSGQFRDYYTDLEFLLRPNQGFAFGAWNDLVNARIDQGADYTHYFLMEDDYVPHRPDFIDLFMSLQANGVGWVESAAHPSGMLIATAGIDTKNKFGSVFDVKDEVLTYTEAERVERALVNHLKAAGYRSAYVSDLTSAPYLADFPGDRKGRLVELGVPDVPPAIAPIFRPEQTIPDPQQGIQYDISLLQ